MTEAPRASIPVASPGRIAAAVAIALAVAIVLLVVAVLPAEYGIDPLGVGRRLGLDALASPRSTALATQPIALKRDARRFVLGPYEMVEFKYRLEQRSSMVYSWRATHPVMFDFHSEPDGAPEGYAESFAKGTMQEGNGVYTAPFSGIHGWYWENPGSEAVTIDLATSGFFVAAREFYDGGVIDLPLSGPENTALRAAPSPTGARDGGR